MFWMYAASSSVDCGSESMSAVSVSVALLLLQLELRLLTLALLLPAAARFSILFTIVCTIGVDAAEQEADAALASVASISTDAAPSTAAVAIVLACKILLAHQPALSCLFVSTPTKAHTRTLYAFELTRIVHPIIAVRRDIDLLACVYCTT